MLVIGASQLSKYLAQIAVGLDYQVTICDPRVEYTETWDVPGVTLVKTMPDDTVQAMKLDERCAVVALTHDPKLDDLALMEALKSRAFYVGALGSRANNAKRRERLVEMDLSAAEIARLHGPIGLYIGSRTPPEIAISILAEITAVKNGVALPEVAKIAGAKAASSHRSPARREALRRTCCSRAARQARLSGNPASGPVDRPAAATGRRAGRRARGRPAPRARPCRKRPAASRRAARAAAGRRDRARRSR